MIATTNTITRWLAPLLSGALLWAGSSMLQDPEKKTPSSKPSASAEETQQDPVSPQSMHALTEQFPRTGDLLKHLRDERPNVYKQLGKLGARLGRGRERRAMELAREHHPELARLIQKMRKDEKDQPHRSAMRELCRDVARIESSRRSSDKDYEAALDSWRARSKLRMTSARLMASTEQPGPEQLAELRILARATVQAERAQLERRAARARSQLAKIEERLAQPADDAVTAQLERMKDRIQNHRSGRRPHGRRPGGGRGRGRGEGGRRKKEQGDKK